MSKRKNSMLPAALILIGAFLGYSVPTRAQVSREAVPDEVALLHLFRVIQDDSRETDAVHARRVSAFLASIGLGVSDRNKLLARANQFKLQETELSRLAAVVRRQAETAPSAEHRKQLEDLNRQKSELLAKMLADITTELSPSGSQLLRSFIDQRMKPRIQMPRP